MRGIGRASGAITIVNALLAGRGAALGIQLGCEVIAELDRTRPGEIDTLVIDPTSDTPLARASAAAALRWVAPNEGFHLRLAIRSDVPWACGLKSSSAVSVAVLDAVARARGRAPPAAELAERSARLCRDAGLSATGAFDDALACAGGGLALAENLAYRAVSWGPVPEEWVAVLWVPPGRHAPSPEIATAFAGASSEGEGAFAAARSGDIPGAMARNSRAVERALGLDYERLRRASRAAGAIAGGISGMGPAFAALAPRTEVARVAAALPSEEGEVRTVPVRPLGGPPPPVRGGAAGAT
jgi:shikimate kinase